MLIAAGFIVVYFSFTIVGNRLHQYQLDRENTQLEQRIAAAQSQYGRLQALHDWMQSDSFIETMARRQGLVRPGDHTILVSGGAPATPAPDDGREWWERYFEP